MTVEQGKTLNEELKHTVQTTLSEAGKPAREFAVDGVINNLDKLTPDELAQIRTKLQEIEETDEGKGENVE